MSGISETVSKKRGRPKAVGDLEIAVAKGIKPEAKTWRGLQNVAYAQRAVSGLWDDWDDLAFLPLKRQVESGDVDLPWTLLQEIGRLPPDEMLPIARQIDDQGLTGKGAVVFVRRCRVGEPPQLPFNQLELLQILSRAIDTYAKSHRCEPGQVLVAVESLLACVSEIDSENQEGGE